MQNEQKTDQPEKQRPFNIFTDFVRTHNLAVDLCAACIAHYRSFRMPLKTIYLKPRYFGMFKKWVAKNIGEEQAEERKFEFDGVNIEKGSIFQLKSLTVEFWPMKIISN